MIEHHLADIAFDDNALALSVVIETGHGGEFLTHSHTLDQCRSVPWTSLMDVSEDQDSGDSAREAYLAKVNKTLERILSSYRQPLLAPELRKDLESYLAEIGVDAVQLAMLQQAAAKS